MGRKKNDRKAEEGAEKRKKREERERDLRLMQPEREKGKEKLRHDGGIQKRERD